MNTGKQQISATQLMFSIASYMMGSTLLTGFVTSVAKQDTWITLIFAYIASLPIIWIYVKLAQMYPQKSIIEITIITFGGIIGRVISALYIFFFFTLSFLNTRIISDFMTGYVLPETPIIAIAIMFIIVCAVAVRKGVETFTRYSLLIIIMTIIIIFFNATLLLKNMELSNFLPMLSLPTKKYIQATHNVIMMPFCNIFIFTMLLPYVKQASKVKKAFFSGLTIGAALFLFIILRDTAVLGGLNAIYTAPTYEVVRMIDVFDILTRMDVLFANSLIAVMFFKISIIFFATVLGIAQVLNLKSYKILVPIFAVMIIVFTIIYVDSASENANWATNYFVFYSTFFELILPIITLATAIIKEKLKSDVKEC